MKDKIYNNADSFAKSFDEEWQKANCDDNFKKIDKVIEILSEHPFVISNPDIARTSQANQETKLKLDAASKIV